MLVSLSLRSVSDSVNEYSSSSSSSSTILFAGRVVVPFTPVRCSRKVNALNSGRRVNVVVRLHTTTDRIRMHKNRLRISDATAADNGVYDCRAENVAAAINSTNSFLLSVSGNYTSEVFTVLRTYTR